jgi:hypothetical protein
VICKHADPSPSTAYVLVIRVYGQQSSAAEQQNILLGLLPFLSEKSMLVMKGVEEAYNYVLSNLQENLVRANLRKYNDMYTDI